MKRTFIPLMLCLAFALLLAACGGSDTSSNNSTANTANKSTTNTATTTNTTSSTTNTSTTSTSSSGEKIGVPECDEYIAKYEACINSKVPEANRAQLKTVFDQSRAAWRTAASNPQAKAMLPEQCKKAMDSARAAMKPYGCDF